MPDGPWRRGWASRQPHDIRCCCSVTDSSLPVHWGSAVLACVARQLSTVNALSMLMSKCRRRLPVGSSRSARELTHDDLPAVSVKFLSVIKVL